MSPCLVAQTPMDKLITDIAFLVIAHHGGIQKPVSYTHLTLPTT